jgi:hypothetical protein
MTDAAGVRLGEAAGHDGDQAVSGDRPQVTVALLRELLDHPQRIGPVLYVEGPLLEVRTSIHVNPDQVVVSKEELVDWLGFPIPDETLEEILGELQEKSDLIES